MKIIAAILVVFAVVSGAWLVVALLREDPSYGFRESVRDPQGWREEMEERQAELRALENESLSDDELRQCVIDLLDDGRSRRARMRLEHHGKRAAPFLLEALGDERFRRFDGLFGAFGTICRLLEPHVSADMVPAIAPSVTHPNEQVRKDAAMLLGKIGSEAAVSPVVAALRDEDDFVRSYALMGILKGIEEDLASRSFLDRVFEAIVPLLGRSDVSASGDAPRALLAIDRERAIPVLLDPRFFHTGNRQLHYILENLNDARVVVPRDRLTALLDELQPVATQHPHNYVCGQALIALAVADPVGAEPRIREWMDADDDIVRENATRALAVLHGLPDVHGAAFDLYARADYDLDRLQRPVQNYLRVRFLVDQVNNGGYSQYFFNGTGDEARETPAALRAIGAEREAAAFEESFHLFGEDGPSPDREIRQDQLARIARESREDLEDLEAAFPSLPRDVEKLLLLYAIANKEAFRSGDEHLDRDR